MSIEQGEQDSGRISPIPSKTRLPYPMSAFNYVFSDLDEATYLRIAIPESTVEWLAQFAGDFHQHASTGFTPQEALVHKQDHRRLFFMLLRIVLPNEATQAIDDVQRAENLKNESVEKHQFEDAARWLYQRDSGLNCLSAFITDDLTVRPAHIQRLFDLLASVSRAKCGSDHPGNDHPGNIAFHPAN